MANKADKSVRRKLLWGVGLLLLVLIGAGLYVYTIGLRTMLEHAESLTFRRMAVTSVEEDAFRFFYATNRKPGDPQGGVKQRYRSQRESSLKFGSFDTRIEPSLGLGIIIDPSKWFLNEEIQLLRINNLQRQAFIEQLRKQVDASPERSLLLVVHGFREAYPSALRKTAFLAHVLDINTPVLLFDWPGDQGSSLRGYRRARSVASESGAELAETIRLVLEEVQPDRLWLMANSMGGQVVVKAFSELYQDAEYADSQTEIENVILTAADVDHASFNETFKQQIKALSENITVYVSSNDRALFASRLINRGRRLGESTVDPANPDVLDQAVQFAGLLEHRDESLVLVDVTPVNRTRNFHNFSLETPEYFDDLFLRMTGTDPLRTRNVYPVVTPDGAPYYVLTRGR